MEKRYKSYRILGWAIVDENGKVVSDNPSKEELKGLQEEPYIDGRSKRMKRESYNLTNTCEKIRQVGFSWRMCGNELKSHHAHREYNKEGKKTGRWICDFCYNRYDPNRKNLYKERYGVVANSRTGNILQGSNKEKGDMFERLTSIWREVKILSIENDYYMGPIDHSRDSELGIIQTKGRFYNSVNRRWSFSGLEREYNKEFDFMISYCADKDGKYIEKIYIFPKSEIIKRKGITIVKNPSRWTPWYEQYRVIDEEIIKKINDIWKEIIKR